MARGLGTPSRVLGVETLVTPGLRELRQQVLGEARPWDEGPEDPHRGPAPLGPALTGGEGARRGAAGPSAQQDADARLQGAQGGHGSCVTIGRYGRPPRGATAPRSRPPAAPVRARPAHGPASRDLAGLAR